MTRSTLIAICVVSLLLLALSSMAMIFGREAGLARVEADEAKVRAAHALLLAKKASQQADDCLELLDMCQGVE